MVQVSRISILDGVVRTIEIPLTETQFAEAFWAWREKGLCIQDAFPTLTASQREFIKTGITDDQWEETFSEDEAC
jgi:hypothetical protein